MITQKGQILGDSYECLKELGQGGQSTVWLVRQCSSGQFYAAKRRPAGSRNPLPEWKEAEILHDLSHPAIPCYQEEVRTSEGEYLIMEFLEGINLRQKLEWEGRQEESEVVDWGLQLCDLFLYLHERNIIYRDLKPGNLILSSGGQVRLIDFGCARIYDAAKKEDTDYLGTRGYAAPELYGNLGQSNQRTDIFCFGMTLYHLLSGISPAELSDSELPDMEGISPAMEKVLRGCTAPKQEERWQDFEEIRQRLLLCRIMTQLHISGHGGGSVQIIKGLECRKRRAYAGIAAAFLILFGDVSILNGAADFQKTLVAGEDVADFPANADFKSDVAGSWNVLTGELVHAILTQQGTDAVLDRAGQSLSYLILHTEELCALGEKEHICQVLQQIRQELTVLPQNTQAQVEGVNEILKLIDQENAILMFYQNQTEREEDLYSSIHRICDHISLGRSDFMGDSESKEERQGCQ